MLTKRTSTEHCQPEPSPRSDGVRRRERKRIKVEVERLRVGLGEPSSYVWPLNKRGEAREKSVFHWARSLFSASLYADALSVEPRRAAQEASPATRHGSSAYVRLCLLDLPSPTEHLKQETHESHMSAPPNTHTLSHTHTRRSN